MEIDGDNAEARAWLRVAQQWLANVEEAMLMLGECYSELATMLEQISADMETKLQTGKVEHGD